MEDGSVRSNRWWGEVGERGEKGYCQEMESCSQNVAFKKCFQEEINQPPTHRPKQLNALLPTAAQQ